MAIEPVIFLLNRVLFLYLKTCWTSHDSRAHQENFHIGDELSKAFVFLTNSGRKCVMKQNKNSDYLLFRCSFIPVFVCTFIIVYLTNLLKGKKSHY